MEGEGRARASVLARLVGAGDQDVHGDRRPSRAGARADALRDLGLRGRLLVRPHEERLSGRAVVAIRGSARRAHGRVRASRRTLPAGREPGGARPARPRGDRRGRLPRPAVAPDLPRRRRARARAAVRASGRRGNGGGGDGAGDRAGDLLGRRRRAPRRGQLPDHGHGCREALVHACNSGPTLPPYPRSILFSKWIARQLSFETKLQLLERA